MNEDELIQKITLKKEFSQLPEIDIRKSFEKFNKSKYTDEEKIKLTRDFLRKAFSAFASNKILSPKNKDESWILRKHLSTRERLPFYEEVYKKSLKNLPRKISVFDFGSGINGFSYNFFKKAGFNVKYYGFESVGQLVDLMNSYFSKNKFSAKAFHLSLFENYKIKEIIKSENLPKVLFLFKVIDALDMIENNYSKKFLLEISSYFERFVVSFATRSMSRRERFSASRRWIFDFIQENFLILDNFEIGGERYIVFEKAPKNL